MEIYLKCVGCGNPLLKVTQKQLMWLCYHYYGSGRFSDHYIIQLVRKPKLERSFTSLVKWLKKNGIAFEEICDYSAK